MGVGPRWGHRQLPAAVESRPTQHFAGSARFCDSQRHDQSVRTRTVRVGGANRSAIDEEHRTSALVGANVAPRGRCRQLREEYRFRVGPLERPVLEAYMRRLSLDAEPPSVKALARLHRRHAERIPYETLWIHGGERWGIDPHDAAARIAFQRRGGY